jgi:glutamate transport system permease protein
MSSVLFDVPGPVARRRHLIGGIIGSVVLLAILGYAGWRLWQSEQITPDKWEFLLDPSEGWYVAILQGILQTLAAAGIAIVLSVVFGLVCAIARISDKFYFRWPALAVVEFFRAVPLVLLILFIFLAFGTTTERFGALIIALMLYNGSVLAEVFRAGLNAVPRGQSEAAYALGLRKTQVIMLILAPQAITTMLPAIISQCVVALKDTALGYIISSEQLSSVIKQLYSSEDNPFAAGIVAAAIYIAINYGLSRLAQWLEARQRRKGKAVVDLSTIHVPAGTGMGAAGAGVVGAGSEMADGN